MHRAHRGWKVSAAWGLVAVGLLITPGSAFGQLGFGKKKAAEPAAKPAAAAATAPASQPGAGQIRIDIEKRLVDPNEPIAIVNNEPITRQQLADECVARKGEEILETLIARKLIDQAIRSAKVEVTPGEIDAEIERIAAGFGVSRDGWLATLARERKISPSQYTRDIIYPALALKKLAAPHVQVTDKDIQEALEGQFGTKIRAAMIMFNDLKLAKDAWAELSKNPGLFEQIARERSIDRSTAGLGGTLPEPIARHATPQNVSDKLFEQLVDGPADPDGKPTASTDDDPKDGDLSGIIQVTDVTWAIFRRIAVIPAQTIPNDDLLRQQAQARIYDQKIQEKIAELYTDMLQKSAIENLLTAQIQPDSKTEQAEAPQISDTEVKLMSNPGVTPPPNQKAPAGEPAGQATLAPAAASAPSTPAPAAPSSVAVPKTPVGITPADAKRASAEFRTTAP